MTTIHLDGFSTSLSSIKGVSFRPGEKLAALVLKTEGTRALLFLKGTVEWAQTQSPLPQGERVLLQVVEQTGDQLLVKSLPTASSPPFSPADLGLLLQHLGVKDTPLARQLLLALDQMSLPLEAQTLATLTDLAGRLNAKPEQLPALVWLWDKGLPQSPAVLTALENFLASPTGVNLVPLLQLWSREHPENENLAVLQKAVQQLILTPDMSSRDLTGQLQQLRAGMGLDLEAVLARIFLPDLEGAAKGSGTDSPQASFQKILLSLIQENETGNPAPVQPSPSRPEGLNPTGLQEIVRHLVSLPPGDRQELLTRLLDLKTSLGPDFQAILQHLGEPGGEKEAHPAVNLKQALLNCLADSRQTAEAAHPALARALSELTGLQISNTSTTGHPAQWLLQGWIQLPLTDPQPFMLKFKQQPGRQPSDPPGEVSLFLESPSLGPLVCQLTLVGQYLSCAFQVSQEQTRSLLESRLDLLRQRMQTLPWQCTILPTRLKEAGDLRQQWQQEILNTQSATRPQLDARV